MLFRSRIADRNECRKWKVTYLGIKKTEIQQKKIKQDTRVINITLMIEIMVGRQ